MNEKEILPTGDVLEKTKYGGYPCLRITGKGHILEIIHWSNDDTLSIIIDGKEPAVCVRIKDLRRIPITLCMTDRVKNMQKE